MCEKIALCRGGASRRESQGKGKPDWIKGEEKKEWGSLSEGVREISEKGSIIKKQVEGEGRYQEKNGKRGVRFQWISEG